MHDPMTLAFSIRGWLDVWHVDPERGGDEDSCGYMYPKVPQAEWVERLRSDLDFVATHEATVGESNGLKVQREREGSPMWLWLWLQRASFWHRRKPLSNRLFRRHLFVESFPGSRDDALWVDDSERRAWIVARIYLKLIRPWWKHPRWHFWHWDVRFIPFQRFKRWAWSRCSVCGKRFTWGYAPVGPWHGVGPRWFRGEPGVRHVRCDAEQGARRERESA